MDIKEIHKKLEKQCPPGYKVNEIILFAYPYRRVIVPATVNKTPEKSIQQVYSVLIRAIKMGYDTDEELRGFLGLNEDDFIIQELYFLRERGYIDLISGQWLVTEEGNKFIEDNSILKVLQEEDFEFLIDAVMDKALAKDFNVYSDKRNENKINEEIDYPIKDELLLHNKHEELADIYKYQHKGKAYLVDYNQKSIKFDQKMYHDYYLIEYIPTKEKEGDFEPRIEVRNADKHYTINKRLTSVLGQRYPGILYDLSSSERVSIANLREKEDYQLVSEFVNTSKSESTVSDTRTLSIWETQAQFEEALRTVKKKILIESPWIKRATLKYIHLFKNALERGAEIIILYGIEGNDEHHRKAEKEVENLDRNNSNFHLVHLPTHFEEQGNYNMTGTHRKLIIKDNDYYIQGSFNFLSFNKEEGQKVANEESIMISKNVAKKWDDVFRGYDIDQQIIGRFNKANKTHKK
ncbi:hypothetical protein [Aureispira sp. CCB-E]|uniref:hypothetical protein n=1 Tax=Aureispira sp. CCB-E TaxID=3051121 RepID=UPI0028688D6E|nr:hypothetical protein [Aureispira sp. CCB-E]WMX16505.1 hypothetical protein QP953_09015 [Aureispira sp. CCB-E]